MRMVHYFAALVAVAVPALFAAAGLGIYGKLDLHIKVALAAAILVVGLHSLLIIFMIVTGRVLREAVRARDLPTSFLDPNSVQTDLAYDFQGRLTTITQDVTGTPTTTNCSNRRQSPKSLVRDRWSIPFNSRSSTGTMMPSRSDHAARTRVSTMMSSP